MTTAIRLRAGRQQRAGAAAKKFLAVPRELITGFGGVTDRTRSRDAIERIVQESAFERIVQKNAFERIVQENAFERIVQDVTFSSWQAKTSP
jgi:hypothetical protein